MIVLDTLPRGEGVGEQGSADAVDLIGAHRCADAAAAESDAAFDPARGNGICKRQDEIGIVVAGLKEMSAESSTLYLLPGGGRRGFP